MEGDELSTHHQKYQNWKNFGCGPFHDHWKVPNCSFFPFLCQLIMAPTNSSQNMYCVCVESYTVVHRQGKQPWQGSNWEAIFIPEDPAEPTNTGGTAASLSLRGDHAQTWGSKKPSLGQAGAGRLASNNHWKHSEWCITSSRGEKTQQKNEQL